jgi:hypothetical protein
MYEEEVLPLICKEGTAVYKVIVFSFLVTLVYKVIVFTFPVTLVYKVMVG